MNPLFSSREPWPQSWRVLTVIPAAIHPRTHAGHNSWWSFNRTILSANSKEEVLSPPNWTQSSPWLHLELMWITNRAGEEGPWPVGQCSVWVPPQNTEDTIITSYYTRTGLLVAMALESVFPLIMVNLSKSKIIDISEMSKQYIWCLNCLLWKQS